MAKITELITNNIIQDIPISFTKFGDGEYLCMTTLHGKNSDHDQYHPELAQKLKEALPYLFNHPTCYIGKWTGYWGNACVADYYESLGGYNAKYGHYHTLYNDEEFNKNYNLLDFVKAMQSCQRKKILFTNKNNEPLTRLFRTNIFVEIPMSNWSYNYVEYLSKVIPHLEKNCLLIVGAGMCSKVLAHDLLRMDDSISYIDIGSGFDMLCGNNSRGWSHSRESELEYYKSVLPEDWK